MKLTLTLITISIILLVLICGCSTVQNPPPGQTTGTKISGIQQLMLTEQDLQQLGMARNLNATYLQQIGITENGTNCHTEGNYGNVVDSSQGQYGICTYLIPSLNNTQVVIQFSSYSDTLALNGSYQYDSLHLYSVQGLLSENDYGDQSRFRMNNPNDYGGQYNDPNVYYYHLWFTKGLFLVHITSGGTSKEAKQYIADTGHLILAKFG